MTISIIDNLPWEVQAVPSCLDERLKLPERQTLAAGVTATLRDAIYRGKFRPGEKLRQAHLATELGVSQASVREAFTNLERDGLVERTANQGAMVASLTRADIEEIAALRPALEVLAVRLVIRHGTAADLDKLSANIRETELAKTPEDAALLDLQFHELLMTAARNQRLLNCWRSLVAPIQLALLHLNGQLPGITQSGTVQNHSELLELIRTKDEAAAVAHTERSMDWIPDNMLPAFDRVEGAS